MHYAKYLLWLTFGAVVIASNVVTYKVDEHFDYVKSLETKVDLLEGKNDDLNGENLGLKSVLGDRPEPSK